MTTHLVIPDTQCRPDTPTDHLRWIGLYVVDRQPDVIVHLGDHWDMRSLSRHRSNLEAEGARYEDDVEAGNEGFRVLDAPLDEYNRKRGRAGRPKYTPRKILLRGNHEDTINRAVSEDPKLEGTLSEADLESPGWEVHPFLKPVEVNGVHYAHYFYRPLSGRPHCGTIENRLKTIGHTFTMGHQQTLLYGLRFVAGRSQHGLVAGACYLHDEEYKGPQGNAHWRGVIVKHEVDGGSYDPMFVSLDYLCKRYEGVTLAEFMESKCP